MGRNGAIGDHSGERLTTLGYEGLRKMFNYVGGGLIYVRDAGAFLRCAIAGVADVWGFGILWMGY